MDATRPSAYPPSEPSVTSATANRQISVVLYQQPGIRITPSWFVVGERRYAISELSQLWIARGPRDPLTARIVAVSGGVLAGIGVALGYTHALYRLSPPSYLILGAATLVPVLLATLGNRWRPPDYELWGRYQGTTILLYCSDDERQFGRVTRALLRAREAARHGGVNEAVAATSPWPTAL